MSLALDTSVVLRLLTGSPPEQAAAARAVVERAAAPVAVSDLVAGESYFALRHHYRVPHGEAVAALASLLADPRVQASGVAPAVLNALAASPARGGPGLMDQPIAADYARDGHRLLTFDRDLARFAQVTALVGEPPSA